MTSWLSRLGGGQPSQDNEQDSTTGGQAAAPIDGRVLAKDELAAEGTGRDPVESGAARPDGPGQDARPDGPGQEAAEDQPGGDDQVVLVVRGGQIVRDEQVVQAGATEADGAAPAAAEADDAGPEAAGAAVAGPDPAEAGPAGADAMQPVGPAGPAEPDPGRAESASAGPGAGDSGTWQQIQALFVDDPPASVTQADGLVTERIEGFVASVDGLIASVKEKQRTLLAGWPDADTEQLRQALHQYRELWQRLDSVSFGP